MALHVGLGSVNRNSLYKNFDEKLSPPLPTPHSPLIPNGDRYQVNFPPDGFDFASR